MSTYVRTHSGACQKAEVPQRVRCRFAPAAKYIRRWYKCRWSHISVPTRLDVQQLCRCGQWITSLENGCWTAKQWRIFTYCINAVNIYVNVNFGDFFALSTTTNTRGHKYKLFKPRCIASIRQKFFVDRVLNVWNAQPFTVNFASLNVLPTALKRFISLVFSLVIFYLCDKLIEYVPNNCFITRFRAAVSVLVWPCCPALLKLYRCKCAQCCTIGQIKWWWWMPTPKRNNVSRYKYGDKLNWLDRPSKKGNKLQHATVLSQQTLQKQSDNSYLSNIHSHNSCAIKRKLMMLSYKFVQLNTRKHYRQLRLARVSTFQDHEISD